MSVPIKLKSLNCDKVALNVSLKKEAIDLPKLFDALLPALKRKKRGVPKLPFFLAVEAANPESDCHLHVTLRTSKTSELLSLELELVTLHSPSPAKPDFPITIENIGSWLGGSVKSEIAGSGFAGFSYTSPAFRSVIPLPYSGELPIESSVIRKSSIAGVDVEVGESDIGLQRFLVYKPKTDTIVLSIIFGFAHAANYGLFAKLIERAVAISSVLVLKEKQDASVVG
jgi:hypothetical protein